eukprot:TRINITY_DN7098_c0_g1_i1.p1 TRINITY_DN7098_c0_g1~~TRINITY_DN7098_c0_g1_i1.p1  ORF type:complete len:317 (-),score=33.82 TRINITY_DN7098_c0_g1_i1:63-1013(-)
MSHHHQHHHCSKKNDTIIGLIAGASAGAVSRTVTAPMDRLKTLMQIGRGVPLRPPHISKTEWKIKYAKFHRPDGIIEGCKAIYREGGWKGFWRGNGINVLKVIPDEALKYALKRYVTGAITGDPDKATLLQHIVSGSLSGAISQTFIYPLEVVKTRLTVSDTGEFRSVFDCIKYTYKNGGLKAFYRGYLPNILGVVPFQGTYFGLFFSLVGNYEEHHNHKPPRTLLLSYSVYASTLAVLVSYPFNLVRTKLQTQGVNGRAILYDNMYDCFKKTLEHEGPKGLFRGILANYLKALPSLTLSLLLVKAVNDQLRSKIC